ncbi:aminotransferase class III-fold pyridoxal phosphate-dependent enzyme [Lachnospiraceae bacterium 29-84]
MSKGQELYRQAKKIIPGGTQLLSKRPEMWLPEMWPSYYSKAKGCGVWDLDGNHYYDFSIMGVGANVLGYAYDPVDNAAKHAIDKGSMCTLNAPEEVSLAEKLLELHEWADMVRYAKAGGEAMAAAARIARACTGKDIILVCGYHGWHDWYLAANLEKGDPLAGVHLKGLEPSGVPRGLAGTNLIFRYNDLEGFRSLIENNRGKIAAVIMEPVRSSLPEDNFLKEIREITEKENIVLVFDEITAGFRLCPGGSHLELGVNPDMAVFAKAMSNGYPLAAVIGKREAMEAAQDTFMSSTFWTERVGLAAALAAIGCYMENRVDRHQERIGKLIQKRWEELSAEAGIKIKVGGIYPLSHFEFCYENPLVYKTYFTQEMLKKGFLAATSVYVSWAHTDAILEQYFEACGEVFGEIGRLVKEHGTVGQFLEGPVCHSGFERLN